MKRLFSSSKYEWIFSLTFFLLLVCSMISVLILYFPHETSWFNKIIILIFFILFITIFFIAFLLSFQYAILSKTGIIFKSLICTLSKISWEEVTNISINNQEVASSCLGVKVNKKFIIFSTNENKANEKNKIIFTNKNWKTIKVFLNLYSSNTNISILK